MKLTVLGSGMPLSGAERACSGYLLESQGQFLVFDLGTGAFLNLKRAVHPSKVNALFFSHFVHSDHVADLVGFLQNRKGFCLKNPVEARQLNIFGPTGMQKFVEMLLETFPSLKELNFPVFVEEMQYSSKKIFGFTVKSKPVKHTEQSIGYRIENEGKAVSYSGDTEPCDEIIDLSQSVDLAILQCSYPETIKRDGHSNALQAGEIAKKANAKRLMLTHFFPEAENADLKSQAAKSFKGEIILAKDLLGVEI